MTSRHESRKSKQEEIQEIDLYYHTIRFSISADQQRLSVKIKDIACLYQDYKVESYIRYTGKEII